MNQKEGPVRVVSDENRLNGEATVFTEALVQGDFNSIKVMTEKPVAINGNVDQVSIDSMGNVTLAGGTIKALNVNPGGTGANITVQNGSMVEAMLVSAPAAIEVEGSVQNITFLQGAQGAVVSGKGTVGQASVLAENVQVTTQNTNILVDPSVTNTEGIPSGYQTGAVNVPASGTDGNKTEGTGGGSEWPGKADLRPAYKGTVKARSI